MFIGPQVLALMRKNKTFAEYDRDTQIALAKVMEYLRYASDRGKNANWPTQLVFNYDLSINLLGHSMSNQPRISLDLLDFISYFRE